MSVLVNEFPHRPNVQMTNPSAIMTMDKGKRRLRFTFKRRRTVAMYVTFPKDGGVRIHNGREGAFAPSALCDIVYEDMDAHTFRMTGNGTSAIVRSTPEAWSIEICDRTGEIKTALSAECGPWSDSRFRIGLDIDEEPALYRFFWPIAEQEEFYGFGERWNSLRQHRNRLIMWNCDILSTSGVYSDLSDDNCDKTQSYKNIPLIHSTRNYSMFFNTYLPIAFDMGYSDPGVIKSEIYGTQLDLYVWTKTPADNLISYHKLTGTPFIPPKWAFDYWLGGAAAYWNRPDQSHAWRNYKEVLDRYEENKIRITEAYVENSPTEEILGGFRDRGIRSFMWTNSCLVPFGESELDYDDYRVRKASDPAKIMKHEYIDFTSPMSRDVICDKFDKLWDMGVCGEMVDFGDSMPEDSVCCNGKTGTEMHNEYAYWYGRRMHEAFAERLGDDFILFERAVCAGSHHYTASFGGDSYSSFLGLKRSVWEMLSAAASGISIWGSDIGGFMLRDWMAQEGAKFEELYIRWVQFGTFSPLMRDHSCHGKHHPWTNGERGLRNFKYYYTLRLKLLDAIYSAARKSGVCGGTVVDCMAVAYGMSPSVDLQYMFCQELLVRPIVELGQRQAHVVFPEDGFCSLYDGVCYEAGEQEVEAPLGRIPVFVKPGAVLPYNEYPEAVIPTWEKNQYQEAVLLTAPRYDRKAEIYTDEDKWVFQSMVEAEGYQVMADKPCPRRMVIVLGTCKAVLSSDAEVLEVRKDVDGNRTIFVLSSDWTMLRIK